MELKKEKKLKNPIYYFFSHDFSKYKITYLNNHYTLCGPFYCVCTHMEIFFSKSSNFFHENDNFTKEYSFFGWAHLV